MENIQWQPIIELTILLFTTLGTTITLYLHTETKQQAYIQRMDTILEGIRQDSRDFHEAYRQETKDFHGRLCQIEERNRNK